MENSLKPITRWFLFIAGGFAGAAGVLLYALPTETATTWAWGIQQALTPMFMGASYLGGFGIVWVAVKNRRDVAQIAVPMVLVFAATQLLATLLHLDKFNWSHPMAWMWMGLYALSLPVGLVICGQDKLIIPTLNPNGDKLPKLLRTFFLLGALGAGLTGIGLIVAPSVFSSLWMWSLTPLTSRVIGGWLLAGSALFAILSRPQNISGVRPVLGILALEGLLNVLGVFRLQALWDSSQLEFYGYILGGLVITAVCAYGLFAKTEK